MTELEAASFSACISLAKRPKGKGSFEEDGEDPIVDVKGAPPADVKATAAIRKLACKDSGELGHSPQLPACTSPCYSFP